MNNLFSDKLQIKALLPAAFFVGALLGGAVLVRPALAEDAVKTDDPMLHAMQVELDREKALLVLPGMQRPYFIEYRLDDMEGYEAVANYGALTREEASHQRVVRVTV